MLIMPPTATVKAIRRMVAIIGLIAFEFIIKILFSSYINIYCLLDKRITMKKWEDDSKFYKILSAVLLIATISLAAYLFWPREVGQILQEIALPELSTSGFSKVDKIETETVGDVGSVSLISDCYDLTATVEPEQAASIQRGVDKTYDPRPNAHDIAANVFETLKIDVLMVKITELRESSFYSKLILRQGNTILNLDARPSDAIAIALRSNSSIYINQTLLVEMGEKIC